MDAYVMDIPEELFAMSQKEMIEMYRGHENEPDHFYRNDTGHYTWNNESISSRQK